MAYTPSLRLTLPLTGSLDGTWGETVNNGITSLTDSAIAGTAAIAQGDVANYALTSYSGATDEARNMFLDITGALTAARNVVCPAVSKLYFIRNSTTGGFAVTLKTVSGTGISVPSGGTFTVLYCDGTNVVDAVSYLSALKVVTLTATQVQTVTLAATSTVNFGVGAVTTDAFGGIHVPGGSKVASNEAFGTGALRSNTTGAANTATGGGALNVNTTGTYNTAVGAYSLSYNTSGDDNTAVGYLAVGSNTTGYGNVGVGRYSLVNNTTGYQNVAVGYDAVVNNTTGYGNVGVGTSALRSNAIGDLNTAIGCTALYSSTESIRNTAIGANALFANTIGTDNTAVGASALKLNTNGFSNVGVGSDALNSNTTGYENTAVGSIALFRNTTGVANTACGYGALVNNTTGSGNTAINPHSSAGSYLPVFDPTTQSNRFCMGSTAVTNAYIQVAWTVVSDARDKTDFKPVPHGLDFVLNLKTVAYRYKMTREATEGHGPVRYGFKAQDVLALEGDTPVIVDAEDADKLRFNDQSLIAVLVNALQELNSKFDAYVLAHP